MQAFLLFVVGYALVAVLDTFVAPTFTLAQRTRELVFATTGTLPTTLAATLVWFAVWAAVSTLFYWRERRDVARGTKGPRAFVKAWRLFLLAFLLLNSSVYLGLVLVGTPFGKTFGFRSLPLLAVDPVIASMGYAILRCAMWNLGNWLWGANGPRDQLYVGSEVLRNPEDAFAAFQQKAAEFPEAGLLLHPALRIPPALETRHVLLVSAPGGGKTQVIFPMLADLVERRWPALVYDFKGDYTEAYGEDDFALILSPFDARGAAWDVARDIDTPLTAMEFATQLLPHHKAEQPFFPRAAQDLLTGVIVKLQRELPGTWTFRELVTLLGTRAAVIEACRVYRPAALTALGSLEDKQAAGVFGELRTGTIQLDYLAQAWNDSKVRFSVRQWLTDNAQQEGRRLVILKGSQQFRELDGFFTAMVFTLLTKEVLALADSYERQIWAFLDEFGNLPRIEGIDRLLTAVRSKGLRVVAAIQDIAQIEETYSRPFAQTFFGAFGTVLGGLTSGDTAAYLSRVFGQNQIVRTLRSETTTGGFGGADATTDSQTVVIENALLDSEFSGLEPPGHGRPARFWLKTAGWPIGHLEYEVTPTPKRYAANVPNLRLLGGAPPTSPVTPQSAAATVTSGAAGTAPASVPVQATSGERPGGTAAHPAPEDPPPKKPRIQKRAVVLES